MSEEKPQTAPDITVSIVSFNTRELLHSCLLSLKEREQAGEVCLDVVVADNGSTDGSAAMVRDEYPKVRLVPTGGNVGYGRANNAALAGAQGRYVFILNSDTVVEPGALAAMRDFLDTHPEAGAAGAQLILPDDAIQPSCAADPTLTSVFWEQTYLYKLLPGNPVTGGYALTYWDYKSPRAVEQVCGACLMVRRSLYAQLGGFDPHYFMYFEDTDLCYRIRKTGAQIWFLPEAKIKHMLGGSSAGDWQVRARMIASYNKSRYYFFTRMEGRKRGQLLKATVLLGATLRVTAWSLLALTGRASAREQARIWRSVWTQTRRMSSDGDESPQTDSNPHPTTATPCTLP